jgi:hypothetical protein
MYDFTNRMSLACGMVLNEEYHALDCGVLEERNLYENVKPQI